MRNTLINENLSGKYALISKRKEAELERFKKIN